MATCDAFDVNVAGDSADVFDKVKTAVESNGGVVNGDVSSGVITGNVPLLGAIQGAYAITGNTVTLTITERPFLVPCSTIEAQVRDYLSAL